MARSRARSQTKRRTKSEQALQDIYDEIPNIPACDGSCATACGPITMFGGEWDRVLRSLGRTRSNPPPIKRPMVCPMLSANNRCTVYSVRPYICRIWGSVKTMRCPKGCEPDRWLSTEEAHEIFAAIEAVAGPETAGPLGRYDDLWNAIDLPGREAKAALIEQIKQRRREESDERTT